MIEVKYIDEKFKVKGTFNWGLAGISENEDFIADEDDGEGSIGINVSLDMLKDEKGYDEDYTISPLKEVFEGKIENLDGETAAAILTDYYNDMEKQAKKQQEQINNYFLYRLMETLDDVAFPFWETEEAVLEGYDEVDEDVYTQELSDDLAKVSNLLMRIKDDNKPEKMKDFNVDMRALFKKHLPMFNLDGLLKTIQNEYTYFEGAYVSVQFSDDWDCEYYCGAYEKFEPGFIPTDWHNF